MPTLRTKQQLLNKAEIELADNNAGAISARILRESVTDFCYSTNLIVGSGDHNVEFPFVNNVRASKINGNGFFIAESGVTFPNSPRAVNQYEAYPGAAGIDHDDLRNRHVNVDAHRQYLAVNGTRPMEENLPMGNNWINSSGAGFDNRGLRFEYAPSGDSIHVGSGSKFVFADSSKMPSARGVAKAWMIFDGSGTGSYGVPVVKAYHNVESIQYLDPGKYRIILPSGAVKNANCVAIGNSNSRTTASSQEDFDRNTVGITQRTIDGQGRLNLTFLVLNDAGQYVDAELNELIVYGNDVGEGTQPSPLVIPKS
jgi:hypothetical protein